MLTHRTPHHFRHRHSTLCNCAMWNDSESYSTIFANTSISASGAVTFGAWLASSSK